MRAVLPVSSFRTTCTPSGAVGVVPPPQLSPARHPQSRHQLFHTRQMLWTRSTLSSYPIWNSKADEISRWGALIAFYSGACVSALCVRDMRARWWIYCRKNNCALPLNHNRLTCWLFLLKRESRRALLNICLVPHVESAIHFLYARVPYTDLAPQAEQQHYN